SGAKFKLNSARGLAISSASADATRRRTPLPGRFLPKLGPPLAVASSFWALAVASSFWALAIACFLSGECLGEEGQAAVHAVVDRGVVAGKFLVDVRDALGLEQPVQAARAVDQIVLVPRAAIDPQGLQPLQAVGAGFRHAHRVPRQPVGPALGE